MVSSNEERNRVESALPSGIGSSLLPSRARSSTASSLASLPSNLERSDDYPRHYTFKLVRAALVGIPILHEFFEKTHPIPLPLY
eukprot:m.310345 g.310345  ORF g.310345 m.310345 type:complete len:84 (-) comp55353_c0_seq6:46-297(-)